MEHINTFNENFKEEISFEQAKEVIRSEFPEMRVCNMLDDEIYSGNWIDREQMEDEGYDDEYEYYINYNNGEAEDVVRNQIIDELKSKYILDFDEIDLYDFLKEEYHALSH